MAQCMHIRAETAADSTAITGVIERTFASAAHSTHAEQRIVQALRTSGALSVSLVAEVSSKVVGHVAFSPVSISDGALHWYGLGPLAVEPALQSRGIGAALVGAGLARLRTLSASGCVVLGEPAYYERFGFKVIAGLVYPGPPPAYFLGQVFTGTLPRGEVTYHVAFASEA